MRILCSSEIFALVLGQIEGRPWNIEWWQEHVHSAFIYATRDPELLEKLVRRITGNGEASVDELMPGVKEFSVTPGWGGVMAGVTGTARMPANSKSYVLRGSNASVSDVISMDEKANFLKLTYHGVQLFLSTSTSIVDIDMPLASGIFDIRDHVTTALPIVLYAKWAFANTSWNPPSETSACLVIDDPLLRARHGCLNFCELLSLMQRHDFSTNVAFIPWNWRRNSAETVQLFKQNRERYSLSVHGCDHSRAEFGDRNPTALDVRVCEAIQRMDQHEACNGIQYDKVMVFPQGVFSKAAINSLKRAGFIAAVNNDTIAVDDDPGSITVAKFWNIALMEYDDFPIFTRRYPWEGIENFAFDILLGKPAIIVIHHDYCKDADRRLVSFVKRLNALKCTLQWVSLGEVVRRSYRRRDVSPELVEVEMYATELRLHNSSDRTKCYTIRKRESQQSEIDKISANGAQLVWDTADSFVHFKTELSPGESCLLSIRYHKPLVDGTRHSSLYYRAGTMLRRYLCEMRDNYLTPARVSW
jgi:hypothetical protein